MESMSGGRRPFTGDQRRKRAVARKKSIRGKASQNSTGNAARKSAKKRPVPAKKATATKAAKKKTPTAPGKAKRVTKVAKKPSARKVSAAKKLGRPRIPGDARLDLVFQKDLQAREVFEFLGVATVRELEQFEPDEIIRRLTSPVVQTVGRIRKALAVANRSLANDQQFAIEFREQYMSDR